MKPKTELASPPIRFDCCDLSLVFFLIFFAMSPQAVTSNVLDEDSKAVAGATPAVKGTTKVPTINSSADFRINAPGYEVLVTNHAGLVSEVIPYYPLYCLY